MMKKLKKVAICFGALLAILVSVFALFCAWENWSGARAWKATREKLTEAGVPLDFKEMIPEMPAEDQNFGRTPLIASVTDFTQNRPKDLTSAFEGGGEIIYVNPELRERFLKIRLPEGDANSFLPNWEKHQRANLSKAPDISELLREFSAELAEIDDAALRPESQLRVDIGETFLEHVNAVLPFFQDLREFQRFQVARASLALDSGDTTQAKGALRVIFQLARASGSHPTLIGFLIGKANYDAAISVIWEGMAGGNWSNDDLAWIQNELRNHQDTLDQLENALQFEMVTFQIGSADFLKTIGLGDARNAIKLVGAGTGDSSGSSIGILTMFTPSGIWDHNKAFGAKMMFEQAILPVRNSVLPDPKVIEEGLSKRTPHNFLAALTLPATTSVTIRGFQGSTAIDLVIIACAVEKYRMKNGTLPDELKGLIPEFLEKIPDDIMDPGKPLKYLKSKNGNSYRIYSVGKNRADDGGRVVFKKGKTKSVDRENGDWVWSY